jgi:hypothetical protein
MLDSNITAKYRLVGNLNSGWTLSALCINSYQKSNNAASNIEAFALHAYQCNSFETMRKLAQLCARHCMERRK